MSNTSIRTYVAAAVLLLGLAASCMVAGRRAHVEAGNNTVEILVDYTEVEQIAASSGVTPAEALCRLHRSGVVGVAVQEQTVGDLIDSRLIAPYGAGQFAVEENLSRRLVPRLQAALWHGPLKVTTTPIPRSHACYVTVSADIPPEYLNSIPVGLPENALLAAQEAGLAVAARLVNYPGVRAEAISNTFEYLKTLGIGKVIFQGDQVLGFRGGVEFTAKALRNTGIVFGRIEFAKQKGEVELAAKAKDNVLIVHSIQQNEMPTLSAASIVERFGRAVRERGARICYVRMLDTSAKNILDENCRYIERISDAVSKAGYCVGTAAPLADLCIPNPIRILVGAGAGAAAFLLIASVFDLSAIAAWAWVVITIAGCAAASSLGDPGRKAVSLAAALAFPTWAVLLAARPAPETAVPAKRPLVKALGRVALAFLVSAAGGLLIAGLLSDKSFMIRNEQFAGVKLAHLLPILALALLFGGGIGWTSDRLSVQKRKLATRLAEIATDPVLIWQAAIALVFLALVGVMIARSGNDPGVGVSETELKVRAMLDRILYVRPRTKEFLVGYPALLLGASFALRGFRRAAAPFLVIGAIALISEVNTFCHIHTPLLLSGIRVLNGLVVGCAFGALLHWLVLKKGS